MTKEELLEKLRTVQVRNGRSVYGTELRNAILEFSTPRIAAGASQVEIAAELGIKAWTLNRWHQDARRATTGATKSTKTPKPVFVRLEPVREVAPSLEVVAGKCLVRVSVGFDEATLLRVLSVMERLAS